MAFRCFALLFTWQLRPLVRISKDCFLQEIRGARVQWHGNKDTNMNKKTQSCRTNNESSQHYLHIIFKLKIFYTEFQVANCFLQCPKRFEFVSFVFFHWHLMMYKQTQSSAGWNHPVTPLQSSTPPGIAGIKQMGVMSFVCSFLVLIRWDLSLQTKNPSIPSIDSTAGMCLWAFVKDFFVSSRM